MADAESTTTAIITETASITKDAVIPEPMTVDAKESEPITNDVANKHPIKQNEAELLAEGTQLIKSEQFDKACNILSDALRLTQEKGSATTIGSVDYYIAYGEALLRFAQSSNDLFGAAVRQSQQQHAPEEEDDDTVPMVQMVTDSTTTDNDDTTETSQNNVNPKEEQDDDVPPNQADAPAVEPEADTPSGVGGGDVDTSEDREIAWETFEYARTIMEEYLAVDGNENDNEYLKKLAIVHSFLGEICLEDERHEAALLEFDAALAVQNKCGEGVIPCRERATNHYWACLAAQCSGKMDVALTHCSTALDVLSDHIQILCRGFQVEEECKSHDDVISVAEGVIDKMDDIQKESENGKELKSLVGVMVELSENRKEVERMILKQQEEAQKTDSNAQGLAMMDDADPLAAMINGLIQQCGIDEEELAKMEAMEESNDENKNKSNQKDQGVTTIGFGDQKPVDDNEVIHELNVVKTKRRKRNMKEAGIDDVAVDDVKKMKLDNGDAASADKEETVGEAS